MEGEMAEQIREEEESSVPWSGGRVHTSHTPGGRVMERGIPAGAGKAWGVPPGHTHEPASPGTAAMSGSVHT